MTKPAYERSPLEDSLGFQEALITWFLANKEDYLWRQTEDPYRILVSEVMLQQTTIQSVVENRRFERFIEEFPTPKALAEASEQEILRAWEGLGYYNRVRNLQKTAREVVDNHNGKFPLDLAGLQALPGVGAYTSAAVASFAYNLSAPLVDANVARVFARLFDDAREIDSAEGRKEAWKRAGELVSHEQARFYNGALMELGQKVCRNRKVLCTECPVARYCQTSRPLDLPVKKAKKKATEVLEEVLWIRRKNGDLFLSKGEGSRRKGMWQLPVVEDGETRGLALRDESTYSITKYKVLLKVYEAEEELNLEGGWFSLGDLEVLPIASPVRRVIDRLLLEEL